MGWVTPEPAPQKAHGELELLLALVVISHAVLVVMAFALATRGAQ